jgi:hypothetical protein
MSGAKIDRLLFDARLADDPNIASTAFASPRLMGASEPIDMRKNDEWPRAPTTRHR